MHSAAQGRRHRGEKMLFVAVAMNDVRLEGTRQANDRGRYGRETHAILREDIDLNAALPQLRRRRAVVQSHHPHIDAETPGHLLDKTHGRHFRPGPKIAGKHMNAAHPDSA
jgi:hypothetical protein